MSVLVVGISHRTAPVSILERTALDDDGSHKIVARAVYDGLISSAATPKPINAPTAVKVGITRQCRRRAAIRRPKSTGTPGRPLYSSSESYWSTSLFHPEEHAPP